MPVTKPEFKITYNGKNITANVSKDFISCEYTDHTEGKSDELSITLDDTRGDWINEWYPEKGASLELEITVGDKKLKCGKFELDSISISGPPRTVNIKAMAAGIGKAVRSKNSKAYEKTNLKGIAQRIASSHGMTVEGEIESIPIEYAAQHRKKDLEYLRGLAISYGYVFSIRDKKLIFTTQEKLENGKEIAEIDVSEMMSYDFEDKAVEVYKDSNLTYHNPRQNKTIAAKTDVKQIDNKDGIGFAYVTSGDKAQTYQRVENQQQAKAKSRALLYRENTKQNEGSISIEGNPLLVAGINVMVTGLGVVSGKYHILESRHVIDKQGGYRTDLKVKRVGGVKQKQQQAGKKQAAAKKPVATTPDRSAVATTPNADGITFRTLERS